MNNITLRTGNEWIPGLNRKQGFGIDFAAEDIIDAPVWIPAGSTQTYEVIDSDGHKMIAGHNFRPGTWGAYD